MIRALVLAGLLAVSPSHASHPTRSRYRVVIDPVVRNALALLWDDSTATQAERAYCAAYVVDASTWTEPVYRVWAIAPARTVAADPYGVIARCPSGPNIVLLHTHPPASYVDGHYVMGGVDAWQCEPSATDQHMVDQTGDAFSLIQCDRFAIVTVYPSPSFSEPSP